MPKSFFLALLTTTLLCAATFAAPPAASGFGFAGVKFHKLDYDALNLRLADVNGDGRMDVVVANNARTRIECLLQATDKLKPEAAADVEANELVNDPLFVSRPFLVDKKIFSLEVGDLNGDGRTDMAYYGDPRELVVAYQDEKGEWGARRTFDIADGSSQPAALAIGDVNGDARNDIVLLANDGIYFIYQNAAGKLEAPVKESGLPEGAFAVVLRDFNGDKRMDLMYACSSESAPVCFRFQGADGRLGPEVHCKVPALRGLVFGDADGDGADELIVVEQASGRLVIYKLATRPDGTGGLEGPLERYTFSTTGSRRPRVLALGILTDPKLPDILVSDPDSAEVELFTQTRPGAWQRKASFPWYQGVTDMAVADLDGDGAADVLLLSPDEGSLGWSSLAKETGRLTFPRSISTAGKPSCMTIADVDGDGKAEMLYCAVDANKERAIHILSTGAFAEKGKVVVTDARADPDGLLVADANQDGKMDILLFTPFQEMRVFKGTESGFVDVSRGADYGKGLVQNVKLKTVALADINADGKPEILIAVKNFARALKLDEKDRLQVVDQLNGRSPTSQIVGVAAADLNGDGAPEVVLVDAAGRCLSELKRDKMGLYDIVENFQIGPMNLERFIAGDLTATGKPLLLLLGQNDFTLLRPSEPVTALNELASYETPVRNGRLETLAVGELNNDGRMEFLASEGTHNLMELLVWKPEEKRTVRALNWPVFESKSFAGSRRAGPGGPEPREIEIGDVTGDGKPDIVLLIHDRVVVYVGE